MANRHKKMLNITHHQGNARLNPMRCHVTLVRMSKIQETKITGVNKDVETTERWWDNGSKLVQPLWKAGRRFLGKQLCSLSCYGMRKGTEWWLAKDAKRNYLPASCDPGDREQQMLAEMDQVELS